jgi:DNA-binding protein HU-beta
MCPTSGREPLRHKGYDTPVVVDSGAQGAYRRARVEQELDMPTEGDAVNKGQLVDALESRLGGKRAATEAVEAVISTIVRSVARGERVAISGFGTFEKAARAARTGRNPRTGETVKIKKTSVPKFKAGTAFKGYVANPKSMPKTAAGAGTPARKTASSAAPAKKATATKATTTRSAARKTTATPGPAKQGSAAKKSAPAKKSTAKTTTAKKSAPAKKSAAKTTTAKTTTAKTTAAKKATAGKTTAKRAAKKS